MVFINRYNTITLVFDFQCNMIVINDVWHFTNETLARFRILAIIKSCIRITLSFLPHFSFFLTTMTNFRFRFLFCIQSDSSAKQRIQFSRVWLQRNNEVDGWEAKGFNYRSFACTVISFWKLADELYLCCSWKGFHVPDRGKHDISSRNFINSLIKWRDFTTRTVCVYLPLCGTRKGV